MHPSTHRSIESPLEHTKERATVETNTHSLMFRPFSDWKTTSSTPGFRATINNNYRPLNEHWREARKTKVPIKKIMLRRKTTFFFFHIGEIFGRKNVVFPHRHIYASQTFNSSVSTPSLVRRCNRFFPFPFQKPQRGLLLRRPPAWNWTRVGAPTTRRTLPRTRKQLIEQESAGNVVDNDVAPKIA